MEMYRAFSRLRRSARLLDIAFQQLSNLCTGRSANLVSTSCARDSSNALSAPCRDGERSCTSGSSAIDRQALNRRFRLSDFPMSEIHSPSDTPIHPLNSGNGFYLSSKRHVLRFQIENKAFGLMGSPTQGDDGSMDLKPARSMENGTVRSTPVPGLHHEKQANELSSSTRNIIWNESNHFSHPCTRTSPKPVRTSSRQSSNVAPAAQLLAYDRLFSRVHRAELTPATTWPILFPLEAVPTHSCEGDVQEPALQRQPEQQPGSQND